VAGEKGQGKELTQLDRPNGVWVDALGTVYVADGGNNRVTRWLKGEPSGVVVAGGNGEGNTTNQLNFPVGLFFDRRGHMYVADCNNNRVQQFKLENN
jgi:sugar lactone lactonase YvrE